MIGAGLVALASCGDDGGGDSGEVSVVASFYPLAFVAEEVGGDDVTVTDLTPSGAEPHDLELTTDQVDEILDADLAVVMGDGFQPAVEETADDRNGETVEVLPAVVGDEDDPVDPHVWLAPALMEETVAAVTAGLAEADPANAAAYAARGRALARRVRALDAEYESGLGDCERDTIVTAHDAFGRLADRYGLEVEPIAGLSPDEEPSPERLAELADLAEDEGVTTIFTETLVSPDVADTLAREAGGLETAVLNPLEGLTDEELDAGDDYFTVMQDNLAALEAALGCR